MTETAGNPPTMKTLLIGLIGPIGCGKSTVAGWLAARGVVVIDADKLTRELMAPGTPVTAAVFERFGERFRLPDGSLDRRGLGRLVFSDPDSLASLEAIVHPAINLMLDRIVRKTGEQGPPAMALEAVKLVEAGHAGHCDEVWLITFGGALFAAFPQAYATAFSAYYTAFMLLLFALIFRGVSLEFRGKRPEPAWRGFWDVAFSVSSALATFLFGVAVGGLIRGLPIGPDKEYAGTFWDLLGFYPIVVGLLAVALFALHGALFLHLKSSGDMEGW